MEILQRFQDFLNKSLLVDQTQIVNNILTGDKHLEHYDNIYNKDEFKVELSDGEVVGTEVLLGDMQHDVEMELSAIIKKLQLPQDQNVEKSLIERKTILENDLKALEDTTGRRKQVLQWLLVPFWLSEELIQYGEVVFRHMGCNFWGLGYNQSKQLQKEAILSEIFEELNY